MGIIAPQGTIYLCEIPKVDSTYKNVVTYYNEGARFADITSYLVKQVDDCKYVRDGIIRVTINADLANRVNYMVYINKGFSSKPYYCFITNRRYVNNEVFEFAYVIDVFQTWWDSLTFNQTFVEREHCNVSDDTLYKNWVDEGLEIGDTIKINGGTVPESVNNKICIMTTFRMHRVVDDSGSKIEFYPAYGNYWGRTYSGLYTNTFDNAADVQSFLTDVNDNGRIDGVVTISMIPTVLNENSGTYKGTYTCKPYGSSVGSGSVVTEGTPFEGYVPKNKKLYHYPYRYILATTGYGNSGVYKWEECSTNNLVFSVYVTGLTDPHVMISPQAYNGTPAGAEDVTNVFTGGSYPQCSWSNDAYKAWLAQNAGQLKYLTVHRFMNLAKGGVSAVGSLLGGTTVSQETIPSSDVTTLAPINAYSFNGQPYGTPGYNISTPQGRLINAGVSTVNSYISFYDEALRKMAMLQDHEIIPPQSHVGSSSGQAEFDAGLNAIRIAFCTIRKEYAQRIDEFFSCYGYKTNRLKVPNIWNRQIWNYVKTVGSNVSGKIPDEHLKIINKVFDTGVTLWHDNLSNVGNYSLSNGAKT